ncbi:MAG: hypothetical protein GY810_13090 [Aureispira sp.]|nr:hypothetical protein [Aureispira sp.]
MSQKFIIYRTVHSDTVSAIRNNGHEVFYVASADEETSLDDICKKANGEGYLLLTGDNTLAEDLVNTQRIQSGLVLVEAGGESTIEDAEIVSKAIQSSGNSLMNSFTTIQKRNIKSKPLTGA